MKENSNKRKYMKPALSVVLMQQHGVLMTSAKRNGYGKAIEDEWS